MTVTADKETRVIVSNTGFTNPIEIDQYVEQNSHLKVYADTTELTLGVDYTIGTSLPADGVEITITATGLLNAPTDWVVLHDPPMEQGADLSLGGRFGLAYEQAVDALARRLQTMDDKVKRGLRLSVNSALAAEGADLPDALADNIIGWNPGATGLENKGTVPQLATVAGIAADISALSPISANITTVAGISGNVTTVATNIADIQAAVADLPSLAAKANLTSVVRHDTVQTLTDAQQYQARTNIGAGFGFENRLINPLFQVDIEGNAGGVTTSGKHVVEGWATNWVNDVTTQTVSRVAGDSVPYAIRYAVTTGSDAAIAAGHYTQIYTGIEGYDIADAKWGTADAKSIWVCGRIKAPTTGIYCVKLGNANGTRSYVFEVACTAGAWVDIEKEIPGDTSGTWETTNGLGLFVLFSIAMGSDYHGSADIWTAGSISATANQANGLATNGNIYEIEDIRVSVGKPIKTEWRPYALDLAHCQRYYEVGGPRKTIMWSGNYANSARYYAQKSFSVKKRTVPSMAFSGETINGFAANAAPSNVYVAADGFQGDRAANSTGNAGYWFYEWTANARMV